MGLFGTDIVTDWLNGYNLIQEGHVMWGWVMVLIPFVPGAVVGVWFVFANSQDYRRRPIILLLYAAGVVFGTPLYMTFVMFTFCVKLFNPDLRHTDEVFSCIDGNMVHFFGPLFRIGEMVGESYPQSMLGKFY